MKRVVVALALVLVAGTAAAETGAEIYAKRCASCHGKDGKATAMGTKMGAHDLTGLKASEEEIAATISNGKGKMTAYKGKLTDAEIQDVAKYVKTGLK